MTSSRATGKVIPPFLNEPNHVSLADGFSALAGLDTSSLIVDGLVTLLDPEKKAMTTKSKILTALSAGLSFLTAPALGASFISALPRGLSTAAGTFATSMGQAPGVAKSMWPQGSADSTDWQIATLKTQLGDTRKGFAEMLNEGLKSIMGDINNFAAFANHGVYTTEKVPDLYKDTSSIWTALNLYLVSETLSKNGWFISIEDTRSPVSLSGLFRTGCTPHPPLNKCINPQNKKDEFVWKANFVSENSKRGYILRYHSDNSDLVYKSPEEVMSTIKDQGWADLNVLFDEAYNCRLKGNFNKDGLLTFDETGAIDYDCMSQVPVYRRCGFPCPLEGYDETNCPFPDECTFAPEVRTGCLSTVGGACWQGRTEKRDLDNATSIE
ncbi:MAG: hypothetical protein Q9169_007179 [Polycauliona sp. 2 TL-2023]